jgi:hypothetical protein
MESPQSPEFKELLDRVSQLEKRLKEDEAVISGLSAWTLHGFGTLLKHLDDPEKFDREAVANLIQRVLDNMFRTLKLGYRGEAELVHTKDGFDRLYIFAQDMTNMWPDSDGYQKKKKNIESGYHMIDAAANMLHNLDPRLQAHFPFESPTERQTRMQARAAIFQAQAQAQVQDRLNPAPPDNDGSSIG